MPTVTAASNTAAATPAPLLLGLAPLLLAADGLEHGLDLSLLAALVLLPALALQRRVPVAARAQATALALVAATAATAGGWVLAALLPGSGTAIVALAPLVLANAAWWQRLTEPGAAAPLYPTALLCLAPALAGLLRDALAITSLLQPLTRQPAALFVLAACLLAAVRAFSPSTSVAGTDA